MEKVTLCTKRFMDERNIEYSVNYSILSCSAEWGRFYGVEIEMKNGQDIAEKEMVVGLSENKNETERFIRRLWEATALPVELHALCDDFIGEREYQGKCKAA